MKVKGRPVHLYWEKTSQWGKLLLLRRLNILRTGIAKKYLEEMIQLQGEESFKKP